MNPRDIATTITVATNPTVGCFNISKRDSSPGESDPDPGLHNFRSSGREFALKNVFQSELHDPRIERAPDLAKCVAIDRLSLHRSSIRIEHQRRPEAVGEIVRLGS